MYVAFLDDINAVESAGGWFVWNDDHSAFAGPFKTEAEAQKVLQGKQDFDRVQASNRIIAEARKVRPRPVS